MTRDELSALQLPAEVHERALEALERERDPDPEEVIDWRPRRPRRPHAFHCVDCGARNPAFKSLCVATGDVHSLPRR